MSDPTSVKLLTDVSPSLSTASSQSASERPKYFKDASLILLQKYEILPLVGLTGKLKFCLHKVRFYAREKILWL